ncbi:MAG TPA: class I SAM-dependent methyltransferase [Mycobacteriales bacterium]|nr:class I SAM-dependent methyltransferase [Mycobacteriales bacterium]
MAEPNATQRNDWNTESGLRWAADADRRDRVLVPVLEMLLDAAGLRPGEDVLDVGCGCGTATLGAAARSRGGTALGVDISHPMLEVARARASGVEGVTFLEADAQTCDFDQSFDLVISRFGTMFFDDARGAFRNVRRAVRGGGRLCIATWQSLDANEWLRLPGAVLGRYAELPAGHGTDAEMFSQAEPAAVEAMLSAAGWRDIRIDAVAVDLPFGRDVDDAVDYLATTGPGRRILQEIEVSDHPAALAAVAVALQDYLRDGMVRLSAGINIVHARR